MEQFYCGVLFGALLVTVLAAVVFMVTGVMILGC